MPVTYSDFDFEAKGFHIIHSVALYSKLVTLRPSVFHPSVNSLEGKSLTYIFPHF